MLPAISLEELDGQTADLLPRRETLCKFACTTVVNVIGVNLALAINAATIGSHANAMAQQALGGIRY